MSTKNVKKFLELIKTDERLAREVTELMSSIKTDIKPCNEKEVIAKNVLPLAKEYGLDFTIDDFTAVADSEIEELSKDELLSVSGGKFLRTSAFGLLFAAGLGVVPSATSSVFNTPLCEHVAEAAGLPKEIENLILAKIQQQWRNITVFEQDTLDNLADATKGIVHYALKVNNIKFTKNEDIPNLFHCTDDKGETFDVSVDNLIETALEMDKRYSFVSKVVPYIKESLKHLDLSKKADLDVFAVATNGIVHHALKVNNIKFTKNEDIPNLFHCTDEQGERFDVSCAPPIEMALEAPGDIKNDIIDRIRRRAAGKDLSQSQTFKDFVRDSTGDVYLMLYHSEDLTFVPDQNNKLLFHCNRNGTKFNVDVAKLIKEAVKK